MKSVLNSRAVTFEVHFTAHSEIHNFPFLYASQGSHLQVQIALKKIVSDFLIIRFIHLFIVFVCLFVLSLILILNRVKKAIEPTQEAVA